MRRFQAFVLIVLCVLLASLAVPAQRKRYGGAAKTPKIVVEPIDTDALKTLLTQERQRGVCLGTVRGSGHTNVAQGLGRRVRLQRCRHPR